MATATEEPAESAESATEAPFYFKDFVDAEGKRVIVRTKSLQYVCCICKKQFKTKVTCMYHLRNTHNIQAKEVKLTDPCAKDSPSSCSFCSKSFFHRRNMIRHVRTHHPGNMGPLRPLLSNNELKKQACPICDKTYSRISAVNRHIRRRHTLHVEDIQSDVVPCHFCEMRFSDENSCSTHISNYHHAVIITKKESGKDKVFLQCNLCDEQFNEQSALKEHLSYVHDEDLREFVHIMSETEEGGDDSINFKCDVCNLSFTSENMWRCHMKENHKAFPESCCPRCGDYSFKTVEELKSHLEEVHTTNIGSKKVEAKSTLTRETRAAGISMGFSAPELRVLEKIPEWLVKHGEGKLLVAIYK